ncbi:MAG: 30S ribosomal protein S4 [Nitrospinae bacterium]|nr:30S ribosomal protein S4 [Nitrospinota bacterium]
MGKYVGPVCRMCRREGMKLFLKGERCLSKKCAVERRAYPPGMAGQMRGKMKEYGLQLREKQKVKRIYGVLERQFRGYFEKAERIRGVTGENLLRLLETRLDSVLVKLGFASSPSQARQMARHGHFMVNGRKVDIPSFRVKKGDQITVCAGSDKLIVIASNLEKKSDSQVPDWLSLDRAALRGVVSDMPSRDSVQLPIQEQLIVELYSK